jgi:hypothetical protein
MRLATLLFALTVFVPRAVAQYGVNWPTQPSTPMATEVEPGTQTLRVSGVNDFLYTYDVNVIEITTPTPPPAFPSGALAGCADAQVNTLSSHAQTAYSAYQKLFPDTATSPKSLLQTQTDWKSNVKPTYDSLPQDISSAQAAVNGMPAGVPKSTCQSAVDVATQSYHSLQAADTKLNNSPHTVEATFQAKSCKSEILTIEEKYKGVPTGQSVTVRLDAECDEFTVGGGVLMTEIQNRSYASAPLPNQTGNFLSVSGTGKFSPTIVSLLSFNFPFEPFGHTVSSGLGNARLGISTGPVLQLSTSDASSFGWFVGGTLSFFHRLYLTPGMHFGQFADFPPGFTAPGQSIPPNFGTLSPVKRWTGRFGIAITIKGWDASKTLKGGTDQPQPAKK